MQRAFSALSEVTPAIAKVTSIDDLMHLVARQITGLVGVERCSVYMREERQNLFRGCAGCCAGGALPEDIKRWIAVGRSSSPTRGRTRGW
jgi:hypothetical protein